MRAKVLNRKRHGHTPVNQLQGLRVTGQVKAGPVNGMALSQSLRGSAELVFFEAESETKTEDVVENGRGRIAAAVVKHSNTLAQISDSFFSSGVFGGA